MSSKLAGRSMSQREAEGTVSSQREKLIPYIGDRYSSEDAEAFATFQITEAAKSLAEEAGKATLICFPEKTPGACLPMSALWTEFLRRHGIPAFCVVGGLSVDNVAVYPRGPFVFETNLNWEGHSWVAVGDHIGDPSLFRTGASPRAHPVLRALQKRLNTTGFFLAHEHYVLKEFRLAYDISFGARQN